jgi:L-2-hydroxyglutarate oxidase LhgO
MSLLFLFYFALFCFQTQEQPPVSFTEEYIEFRLRETTFTVNGIYYFVNNTAHMVSKEINYPFPVPMSDIDSVHVFDIEQGRFLGFEKLQQGVKDTVKYILTTTKNWGEPLKKAEYTFETEQYRKIRSFSYPPDKTSNHSDQQMYFWRKKDFLPEKDFIVIFRKN